MAQPKIMDNETEPYSHERNKQAIMLFLYKEGGEASMSGIKESPYFEKLRAMSFQDFQKEYKQIVQKHTN